MMQPWPTDFWKHTKIVFHSERSLFPISKMAAMVKVAWWPWLIWSIDIIKGTTQTICRIIGKDNSRYLIYHNGGHFNIGCNVNTTIVCMTLLAGLDLLTENVLHDVCLRWRFSQKFY